MEASHTDKAAKSRIISPFSDVDDQSAPKRKLSSPVWGLLGIAIFVILAVGIYLLVAHLNNPLRILEPFPIAKYMEGFHGLSGSKFRADLRVENDLGWKEGVGRVMVFTIRDDPRPIVVMIPASLATTYFVKGQGYEVELEVKEGGLIYANSCRKN